MSDIAASRGTVWTAFFRKGELRAFDAVSGRPTRTPLRVHGGGDGIEADGNAVWAISMAGITRITP